MKQFLISLSILITLVSCSTVSKEKLRVGITPLYAPLIFKENNQYQGLEADFARALATELDRELEFKEIAWTKMIPSLQKNEIDIVMSGMSISTERSFIVQFLPAYTEISQTLLINKSDKIQFKNISSGINPSFKIAVKSGTISEDLANKIYKTNKIKAYPEIEDAVKALKSNEVNCILHELPVLYDYMKDDTSLSAVAVDLPKDQLAWAVNLENLSLHQQVLDIYYKWKMNGKLAEITSKWIPKDSEVFKE